MSVLAVATTVLSILIPVAMGMVKLAWYLRDEIAKLYTSIQDTKLEQRDWTELKIREAVLSHKSNCRAAQDAGDYVSGIRRTS